VTPTRCVVCGNQHGYCTCGTRMKEPDRELVKRHAHFDRVVSLLDGERYGYANEPLTGSELLAVMLHMDPEGEAVYLCRDCGLTGSHECAYGGWHHDTSKRVLWVTDATIERTLEAE
jgi:hypothetical protein